MLPAPLFTVIFTALALVSPEEIRNAPCVYESASAPAVFALIVIVPPTFVVVSGFCTSIAPALESSIAPVVVATGLFTVNVPAAFRVSAPVVVDRLFTVVSDVPLCKYNSPVPVLSAAAGKVSRPDATMCSGAFPLGSIPGLTIVKAPV